MMYWTSFQVDEWHVTVAATEIGLSYIGIAENSKLHMKEWITKYYEDELIEDASKLTVYIEEIKQYLVGNDNNFSSLPLDLQGTAFQLQVWQALQQIPYGETKTYSQIAQQLSKPNSVRAVASAIGKNPVLLVVPCHRVIAKDGSLSGYRDGTQQKQNLLQLESNVRK